MCGIVRAVDVIDLHEEQEHGNSGQGAGQESVNEPKQSPSIQVQGVSEKKVVPDTWEQLNAPSEYRKLIAGMRSGYTAASGRFIVVCPVSAKVPSPLTSGVTSKALTTRQGSSSSLHSYASAFLQPFIVYIPRDSEFGEESESETVKFIAATRIPLPLFYQTKSHPLSFTVMSTSRPFDLEEVHSFLLVEGSGACLAIVIDQRSFSKGEKKMESEKMESAGKAADAEDEKTIMETPTTTEAFSFPMKMIPIPAILPSRGDVFVDACCIKMECGGCVTRSSSLGSGREIMLFDGQVKTWKKVGLLPITEKMNLFFI
eukprot:gnl/Carplike_NY0171/5012_a6837_297.p1 GENE.gnl/Carplike_NY0171/5012_a6837_297~~gnl/Carplike_NY0171/5012_a6837_297.p1  ORF type:complete len:315 (-),score=92.51 gnl/Carplike_NY0171/5012_a6837_297:94-1038(-)